MFEISLTDDVSSLLADRGAWDRLTDGIPFRSSGWLGPWWRAFGASLRAQVLVARDERERLVGLLPLYQESDSGTLRFLGDGEACSDHLSILIDPSLDPNTRRSLAREMGCFLSRNHRDNHHGWQCLDLDGVVEGDLDFESFREGLVDSGCLVHASSRMSLWIRPRDESWETHLRQHGKTQRRRMRRWSEKFESIDGLSRHVASDVDSADSLFDDLIRIHQARWNSQGETGSFARPEFCEFIRQVIQDHLQRDRLHLSAAVLDGQTIAAELSLIGGNHVLYSYAAGYDIEFAELEPGRILCIDSLLELYRSDLVALDYMRGDESYKKRFAKESRRVYRLRVSAPSLSNRFSHQLWTKQFELKQWLRKQTGRTPLHVAS